MYENRNYRGIVKYDSTDGEHHHILWEVVRKQNLHSEKGFILFLHILLDGETQVLFSDGEWKKKPPRIRNKPVRKIWEMLVELYN